MRDLNDKNYGYEGLIDSFDVDILLDEHDDDYQGDSFYLLRDAENRIGFLSFGWGSCSGCDAYDSASDDVRYGVNPSALVDLRDELWNDVSWFSSLDDLRDYFNKNDVALKWYGYNSAFKVFLKRVMAL